MRCLLPATKCLKVLRLPPSLSDFVRVCCCSAHDTSSPFGDDDDDDDDDEDDNYFDDDGYNDDDGGVRVLADDVSMLISKVVKLKDVFGRSRHTRRPPSDRLIGGFFLPTTVCRKACLKRVSA